MWYYIELWIKSDSIALDVFLRGSFVLNNICLSCWIFGSVLFVVFLKIELDNVVNENYSSQIVEAKITVYESLRVRPVTDHKGAQDPGLRLSKVCAKWS